LIKNVANYLEEEMEDKKVNNRLAFEDELGINGFS